MGLQPIGHNGQVQRLTTALKNICRDYPAGGTVLRELLQNADDAGATEVRFVLDERTHPVDELIDPKLEQYQGPALLAYNNALFTDKDFNNLARLGDSLKLHDGSTTGKFGRGFNSVYNWTDSPSIVSRERLLILDPHYEWSQTGGPVYDFVDNSGNGAIKNHMAAFETVMEHLDQKLDGTIIRIPLRTQAQAIKSEISNRETTVSDVLEVFQSFASEFGESGLLFMRNIERLGIESASTSIEIKLAKGNTLRPHKLKVNDAVKCALEDPNYSFDHSFEIGIEYRSTGESKETTFIVHHSIQCGLMDPDLRKWAKDQNLIPWVAVAAQLPIQSSEMAKGALFTVLPLPITTNQPVHIHGLFSISPDRARLYQLSDKSTQDQAPAKWNNWLFQGPVPVAWTRLLSYLAHLHPDQPAFEKWPHGLDDTAAPLSNAIEMIMRVIEKESLALWPTDVGYMTAKNSLLASGFESIALRNALREARVPVVYVPERLQHRCRNLFKDRILKPKSLSHFLRSINSQIKSWSSQTKLAILEYLLSEPGFVGYGGLELFPYKDGTYGSVGESIAFVHRDELEETLFNLEDSSNLDLEKLSKETQQVLKQGCEQSNIHPSICYRSASSLKEYCMSNIFKNVARDQDMAVLDKGSAIIVTGVWTWISRRGISILSNDISGLWLLPLSNGHYRKVKPKGASSSQIYFAPEKGMGELMRKFDAKMSTKPLPLLNTDPNVLGSDFLSRLTKNEGIMSAIWIRNARNVVAFLEWLQRAWPLVAEITDEDKLLIASLVASHLPQLLTPLDRSATARALSHLSIFQKVVWKEVDDRMRPVLAWTNLSSCSKSIGLLDGMSPVPEIDDTQFLIANWSSSSKELLQKLKLADCLGSVQLIQDHIIPAWESGKVSSWTFSCKEQIAEFILGRFSVLSLDVQRRLRTISLVPIAQLNGNSTSKFALAADLIDPTIPELKGLCFYDEEIIPQETFLRKHNVALRGCGLKTAVDETVVEYRIRCYASTKYPFVGIQKRAQRLLESACRWTTPLEKLDGSNLRRLKWLPVVDLSGNLSMKASSECRGNKDRLLVDSQLPILNISISMEWESRLGWHNTLPSGILLSQLSYGVQQGDRQIVDEVLTYIFQNDLVETLANKLTKLPCVLVSSGLFVTPSHAFRPPARSIDGCDRLQPYLANVDNKFWQDHKDLLIRLEVGDRLQPADLLKVQAILEAKTMLEESDLAVAIEIANLASKFPTNSLAGLKIISETGEFYPIHDINYNDLEHLKSKEKVYLTHPDIPRRTIFRLGIGGLRERLIKGMLEIEDVDDEDEFDQRENVVTRIADTLDRYPVETTFREYLANADDTSGASKISWLLDPRVHAGEKLLTPEMKKFQGPAFLVHNDGVFSDDDFKGFKNVGEGSKAQDRATIGQFGRGSQTMYHWTDVPMIMSGRYLLILDPQQEVLPRNQIKGKRKPGVKLELSKLRDACGDQLVPFEGLWGYTQGLDSYPGTIFRFPLRTTASSALRTSKRDLNSAEVRRLMDTYFQEARISLLFLRRIKSIDFGIQGNPDSGWSVTRRKSLDEDVKSFSELVICHFVKNMDFGTKISGKDNWWVAIEDLEPEVEFLPDSSRRLMKNVECGLAALISSTFDSHGSSTIPLKAIQSRMFNTLPLPISSDLPVHVHATFSLSGDRQSIAVDEYGMQAHGSEWNRYLLQEALPELYLSFLDHIGPQVRQHVFSFWPQEDPPKRSSAELLCASFWKKLPQSSQRLFPKAQLNLGTPQRRAPERFDISQAVFDFLPSSRSEAIASLLLTLGVNLVREIPIGVARHLTTLPELKSVTGPMLRPLFKSDRSRTWLLKEMAKNPVILDMVFHLLIPVDAELKDLDGCHILPLADGTLTTLKFTDSNEAQSSKYYVASKEELKLFDFASSCLVTSTTGTKLGHVLKSGKFNVAKLQLCDVGKLLEMRPGVPTPNPDTDKWLAEFWKFWNSSIDSSLPSINIDAFNAKIFEARQNGVHIYTTPVTINVLPAVVEPSIGEHQQLCDKIPGLRRFNTKFMPKSLVDNERSFDNEASFWRFICALRILSSGTGMETYVKTHLDLANLKILRSLVISHVRRQILTREPERFHGLSAALKSIALWPIFHASSPDQLISADNALMAVDPRLLVPWMKKCSRFIDPQFLRDPGNQDCVLKLGVKKVPTEVLLRDYVLPLPSTLTAIHWRHYQPLVSAIFGVAFSADGMVPMLRQSNIAADGKCTLRKASELYDHADQIFKAAFRHQKETRFLHHSVESYRSSWLRVGLRHRENNFIDPGDYLQCLRVMGARLRAENTGSDPHLGQDSQTVLSPLTAPNYNIQNFGTRDWLTISEESVFRSRTNFSAEPEYRQNTMSSVAAEQKLLCLLKVVSYEHVAVCWSQTSFVVHQPTGEVLRKVPGNGQPDIDIVWRHLQHMKNIAKHLKQHQVRDFLTDLDLTYEYLQDHLDESRARFSLRKSAVWLNLNTSDHKSLLVDDIESSWQGIEELVLSSSCDAGKIKAVRPGLMRFEKLLRGLGCSSITYPTVTRPTLHLGSSVSKSLRQLRNGEKLLDITFSTEGRLIKAHKVVLAAISEKCSLQFSGRWRAEDLIEYDEDGDPDDYLSYHTLSTMIDYAYEEEIDWKEMEVSDGDGEDEKAAKLDLLLDLHKGADCWLIPALKSQVEDKILLAGNSFMNLANVIELQERAEFVGAKEFERACAKFIEQNSHIVGKAHSGTVEKG